MVVENLVTFRVKSYEKLYKRYQQGGLGCNEQRMLGDIPRETEGSELDKIKSLLVQDSDNYYHVVEIKRNGKVRFQITIVGFCVVKTFKDKSQYCLTMGEDGVWEEVRLNEDCEWKDGSHGQLLLN